VIRDGTVFLKSILWTVMSYNPVRILGMIGMLSLGIAFLVGMGLVISRLSGVKTIGPWGVAALFVGLTSGVAGVSLYALGATFNYLVGLFYKRSIRQGLMGHPTFKKRLDSHFGWMGLVAFATGVIVSIVSLVLGIRGWEIARLWLYLMGGAMLVLVGIQLMIYWILIQVLAVLSQRETQTSQDLQPS
jgi:hypothetical protein